MASGYPLPLFSSTPSRLLSPARCLQAWESHMWPQPPGRVVRFPWRGRGSHHPGAGVGGGDSWVCLALVGASIWRPTPTPQGSQATDALGQADSGICPPRSGAGVFFLSSAEGDQISFLFDCIVRGISPTKGPFGLRPVLPGECIVGGGDAWPG